MAGPSPSRRGIDRRAWLAGALAVAARGVGAQASYPSRPITLLVGSGAGSGADLLSRLVAQGLEDALGQPVIVENRVGASGALAALSVVRARPDGYTLFFGSASSTVVSPAAQPAPAFDPRSDLAAVAQVGVGGVPLVVTPSFPARDLAGFIAVVRAHPGKYQYATWGVGTTGHLIMEWIKARTGIDLQAVPYKSVPAIVQDMVGGAIQIGFIDAGTAAPLARSSQLRVLAVSGSRRTPALPDAPLMREQGLAFEVDGWYGLFAPKGTPVAVVERLNREVVRLLAVPALQVRLRQLNVANTPPRSPGEFARTVRHDFDVWREIVRSNGIRID